MPLGWIDVSTLSFNTLLLLERVQLSWLPGLVPSHEMGIALRANPVVEWYLRNKCPDIIGWVDRVRTDGSSELTPSPGEIRRAELAVLDCVQDFAVYAVDPGRYDRLPFLGWSDSELTSLVDFRGKTVVDVGAGTGRLARVALRTASAVFAVEPVSNLRRYMQERSRAAGQRNLFAVDGLITDLPFPDAFADVTMGGHVFGDNPEEEYREMARITKPGGMIILCPGNIDIDNDAHTFLVGEGFEWSRFEEPDPGDGWKRKYWKTLI